MPIFQDSESAYAVVPEGDYVLCVFEFSTDISTGKKTNGSKRYNIVFNIEGTDSKLKEALIDHDSCIWKIDTFLKASGIRNMKKGQAWEFEKEEADTEGVPWINPMGLRCHASLIHDTYMSQRGNEVTKNKVGAFNTDPKLPVLPPDPVLRKKPTSTGTMGNTPF
jgi:hypothetical protein